MSRTEFEAACESILGIPLLYDNDNDQYASERVQARYELWKLAQSSRALPEGYVLVPVEPTPNMQVAGASSIRIETTPLNKLWTGNAVYKAMLAAAQEVE